MFDLHNDEEHPYLQMVGVEVERVKAIVRSTMSTQLPLDVQAFIYGMLSEWCKSEMLRFHDEHRERVADD